MENPDKKPLSEEQQFMLKIKKLDLQITNLSETSSKLGNEIVKTSSNYEKLLASYTLKIEAEITSSLDNHTFQDYSPALDKYYRKEFFKCRLRFNNLKKEKMKILHEISNLTGHRNYLNEQRKLKIKDLKVDLIDLETKPPEKRN